MEEQITLRLPKALARSLAQRAKKRGVPKSQLVREAVSRYLSEREPLSDEDFARAWKKHIGSVDIDYDAALTDPIARQIYDHNFRT